MKVRYSLGALVLGTVVLLGTVGSARAADEWFVLGEKLIGPNERTIEIAGEKGKFLKEDIKQTKITVEGADVQITKVVLHWNNRPDDTITNVGVLKAGGSTAPKDAPGHEATLTSVAVDCKIMDPTKTATLKLWGYD